MSLASLRTLRVAIYYYSSQMDDSSGISESVYVRSLSPDTDGLWWASRGTVFGREASPTPNPQSEMTEFWSLSGYAPITPDGLIVIGTYTEAGGFTPQQVHRVQSVMPRNYWRDAVQVYCLAVDDADATYTLEEPI